MRAATLVPATALLVLALATTAVLAATATPSAAPTLAPSAAPTRAPSAAPTTAAPTYVACAIGQYSLGTACGNCQAGKYSSSASAASACTDCAIGTFASATGSSVCTACAAGTQATANASTSCSGCTAGTFQDGTMTACANCADGTYVSTANATACLPAPAGSFAHDSDGATTYSPCAAGTFSLGGASACTNCAAGRISAANATACADCGIGYFQADAGASACSTCSTGSYSRPGAAACTSCPRNYYQNYSARGECVRCPANTSTNYATGASTCAGCPAGYTSESGGDCHLVDQPVPRVPADIWKGYEDTFPIANASVATGGSITIRAPLRKHSAVSYTFGHAVITLTSQRTSTTTVKYRAIPVEELATPSTFACYEPGLHIVAAFAVDAPDTKFAVAADTSALPYTTRGRSIRLCNVDLARVDSYCGVDSTASADTGTVVNGYACNTAIFAVAETRSYALDCKANAFGQVCHRNAAHRTGGDWHDYVLWIGVAMLAACEFLFALRVLVGVSGASKSGPVHETAPESDQVQLVPGARPIKEVFRFTRKISGLAYAAGCILLALFVIDYDLRDLDPATSRGTENPTQRAFTRWALGNPDTGYRIVYISVAVVGAILAGWWSYKFVNRAHDASAYVDGTKVRIRKAEWARAAMYSFLSVLLLPLLYSSDVYVGWLLVVVPFGAVVAASIVPALVCMGHSKLVVCGFSMTASNAYAVLVSVAYAAYFLGIGFVLSRYGGKSYKWADADLDGAW